MRNINPSRLELVLATSGSDLSLLVHNQTNPPAELCMTLYICGAPVIASCTSSIIWHLDYQT